MTMTTTLRSRRAPCALHGLAVANDGLCVRCRRPPEQEKNDVAAHLAVLSLEATSPVAQLRAEELRATRARRLVRPEPVAPAGAPGALGAITPARQKALEEPSLPPVIYGGSVPNQEPAPTKIMVTFAPEQPAEVPVG